MKSTYVYVKTRASYGKQCVFNIKETNLDEEILPNYLLNEQYVFQNPCHKKVQMTNTIAHHEVQTKRKEFRNNGMFHFEGGWPKEIDPTDEEAKARFRRRVEKEENWNSKLKGLFNIAERAILQNNAINVYDHYFDDSDVIKVEKLPYLM